MIPKIPPAEHRCSDLFLKSETVWQAKEGELVWWAGKISGELQASVMNLSQHDFCSLIYYDCNKILTVDQCCESLVCVLGNHAQSRTATGN